MRASNLDNGLSLPHDLNPHVPNVAMTHLHRSIGPLHNPTLVTHLLDATTHHAAILVAQRSLAMLVENADRAMRVTNSQMETAAAFNRSRARIMTRTMPGNVGMTESSVVKNPNRDRPNPVVDNRAATTFPKWAATTFPIFPEPGVAIPAITHPTSR